MLLGSYDHEQSGCNYACASSPVQMALSCAVPADPVTGAGFPVVAAFCAFLSLQSGLAAQQHSLPCFAASAPDNGDAELSAISNSGVVSLKDKGLFELSCHCHVYARFIHSVTAD